MTDQARQPRRIKLTSDPPVKVRYGRATLTVKRRGALLGGSDLAQAISGYRRGEVDAETVAWAYVRARVVAHSPTFDWAKADRMRVVRLVAQASRNLHFRSRTPEGLARELIVRQDWERERFSEATRTMKKLAAITPPVSGLSSIQRLVSTRFVVPEVRFQQASILGEATRALRGVSGPEIANIARIAVPAAATQEAIAALALKRMFATTEFKNARALVQNDWPTISSFLRASRAAVREVSADSEAGAILETAEREVKQAPRALEPAAVVQLVAALTELLSRFLADRENERKSDPLTIGLVLVAVEALIHVLLHQAKLL